MSRAKIETMTTETRFHRTTSNWGRIGTTTRESGVIWQQGILASKPQRITVLRTQIVRIVGKVTEGNADKGLLYVTSAVRKGIMLGSVRLRHQVMIDRTRIKDRNLDH